MTEAKKLRLLVTSKCHNDCKLCCNKDYDLNKLQEISLDEINDLIKYWEINITGGEPLLFPEKLLNLLSELSANYVNIYTAKPSLVTFIAICDFISGFTVSIHNDNDLTNFIKFNEQLINFNNNFSKKSHYINLRLHVFCDVNIKPINLFGWDVKFIEWQKDCPIPQDENFRRLKELW